MQVVKLALPLLGAISHIAEAYVMQQKDPHPIPRGWSQINKAPADHKISLSIGLKQSDFTGLERHLYEVSDPSHPRYGQHLTQDQVNSFVKPTDETSELVHDWLEEHGINATDSAKYSPARDWITVVLPIHRIERLLDADYHIFRHDDGSRLVRTSSWSLPDFLHSHVSTIQPTNSFFRSKPRHRTFKPAQPAGEWKQPGSKWGGIKGFPSAQSHMKPDAAPDVSQVCNVSAVTPTCLRTYYGTIDYVPAVGKNKVGFCNYLGETSNRSDVGIFLSQYRPEAAGAAQSFKIITIANGPDQQTPNTPQQNAAGTDLEGNLDAETILGITYPLPVTAYNTGGEPPFIPDALEDTNTNEPYLTWVNYVLSQPDSDIPQVISTSYGDDEQTIPVEYARTVCSQFAQLGSRGVSLLFASGDDGVGNNGSCITNDGKNTSFFLPSFPASCPYVTTVGATKNFAPEVAAFDPRNGFASGGGFSSVFARPAYQDAAVSGYLKKIGNLYADKFNASGRAYPDLAAQGQRYVTIWNGSVHLLDGTSASTPTTASIIALLNDALLAAGKKPLGFLNPWLYAKGYKNLRDITSGSAIGCNVSGFPATEGWDPVTGYGTPKFKQLKDALLAQPPHHPPSYPPKYPPSS